MPPKPKQVPRPIAKKQEDGPIFRQVSHEARAAINALQKQESDYTLKQDWESPGSMGIVPVGSKFYKCPDGYYAVFVNGAMLHYRIGKIVLDSIKEKELV